MNTGISSKNSFFVAKPTVISETQDIPRTTAAAVDWNDLAMSTYAGRAIENRISHRRDQSGGRPGGTPFTRKA
jgi:hypothetical protein